MPVARVIGTHCAAHRANHAKCLAKGAWPGSLAVLAEGQEVVTPGVHVVFLHPLDQGAHPDVQDVLPLQAKARQFPSLMPHGADSNLNCY